MTETGARSRILPALAVILLFPAPVAAQGAWADPVVRMLLRPAVTAEAAEAIRAQAAAPTLDGAPPSIMGLVLSGTAESPRVGVLVRVSSQAGIGALRAAGAEIGAVVGDIVSARVPIATLGQVVAAPGIAAVEAAMTLTAVHDSSMRAVNAHLVRQVSDGVWTGFAGQGVIAGIYDSGIDLDHGDFQNPGGSTRLLGLWDQTRTGNPPTGFTYGLFCSSAEIDGNSCPQTDSFAHGTHVAGTAAGDGSDGSTNQFLYAGVAPLADLVVVKGGNGSFSEDRIIDGVSWIFAEAARRGAPAVVNLSLGSQFGPHDGTRLYEQALDQLAGDGRIVVISAGNDGQNRNTTPEVPPQFMHADGLPSAGPAEFVISIPPYSPAGGSCNDFAFVDLWHEPGDRLTITVVRPNGSSASAAFGELIFDDDPGGQIAIENVPDMQPSPMNGDFEVVVRIGDCDTSGPPTVGNWTLRVTPTAAASGQAYHMWLSPTSFGGGVRAFGVSGFNNRVVVSSPGNSRRAVTVGAFVSRVCFPSTTGNTLCLVSQEEVGDIAVFSSAGPTRDGRLKPEITAPGRLVVSALSGDAQVNNQLITPDNAHWILQGTSMAAPHVTGAVALMLQADGSLTPERVKDIFAASARQDAFTVQPRTGEPPGAPNNHWGHGKLDVSAALEEMGALTVVATVTVDAEVLPVASPVSSRQGSVIPFIAFSLAAEGSGAARIDQLGFDATGLDPGAQVVVYRDVNGNARLDQGEPELGSAAAPLAEGDTARVSVPIDLVIAPGESVDVIAGIELSGQVPHNATFRLRYAPGRTRGQPATGSGVVLFQQPPELIASVPARTTVLAPEQLVSVSENPVRSDPLIINFIGRPDRAEIYSVGGRRVADLLERSSGLRVEWDLTNDEGTRIAPGVYLLITESSAGTATLKLIVLAAAGAT